MRSAAAPRCGCELRPQFDELPLVALIDALEAALATPVQTAVKREDEQAFARLNAENLMFCEDAARRVASVLSTDARIERSTRPCRISRACIRTMRWRG